MNWLAHIFLAEPNAESRLGNLLGDLVKGKERENLNICFQRGLKCHQAIDRFTDCHSMVKASKQRISPEYRRFAGILVDVFYDHFLAKNWDKYCSTSLDLFTAEVYNSWQNYVDTIPLSARQVIIHLIAEDWLGSYYSLSGVEDSLKRLSGKLTRRRNKLYNLNPAIAELDLHYTELEQDFNQFFPELILRVNHWHSI